MAQSHIRKAETIAVAVAEEGRNGEVRSLGTIPNRPESIKKLMKKLGGAQGLQICYEAGPTGYALYWQLVALGAAPAARGKPKQKVVTAVARELLGFVWALGYQIEQEQAARSAQRKAAA